MSEAKPDLMQQWDTHVKNSAFEDPVSAAHAFAVETLAKAQMVNRDDPSIRAVLDWAVKLEPNGRVPRHKRNRAREVGNAFDRIKPPDVGDGDR